jgi:hypothetical protein
MHRCLIGTSHLKSLDSRNVCARLILRLGSGTSRGKKDGTRFPLSFVFLFFFRRRRGKLDAGPGRSAVCVSPCRTLRQQADAHDVRLRVPRPPRASGLGASAAGDRRKRRACRSPSACRAIHARDRDQGVQRRDCGAGVPAVAPTLLPAFRDRGSHRG